MHQRSEEAAENFLIDILAASISVALVGENGLPGLPMEYSYRGTNGSCKITTNKSFHSEMT